MFKVEFSLSVHVSIHIVTVAFDLPVIATVPVALSPKCRDLLPASDRALKVSMRVEIPLRVHMFQSYFITAFDFLASPTRRHSICLLLLDCPQRVVVVVSIESSHDLLTTPRPVRKLRRVQKVAQSFISQTECRGTSDWECLDLLINFFFVEIGGGHNREKEEDEGERILESHHFNNYIILQI
jgi:hypothetical protein